MLYYHKHSCLPRAVVTAIAHCHKADPAYQYETIIKGDSNRYTLQKRKAEELMRSAGLENHQTKCGPAEVQKIQDFLRNRYQIKIFDHDVQGCTFIGPKAPHVIHLFLRDEHYNVITSMTSFHEKCYWCEGCNKAFQNKNDHRCINRCPCCYNEACLDDQQQKIICQDCNRYFRGPTCFDKHKQRYAPKDNKRQKVENSVCDRFQKCKNCFAHIQMANAKKHICGQFECRTCRKMVPIEDHLCYMQPIRGEYIRESAEILSANEEETEDDETARNPDGVGEKNEQTATYVFFDFETTQEQEIGTNDHGPIVKHVPNLCIAHIVCDQCRNGPLDNCCISCGPNRRVFEGQTCLYDFCNWLFSNTKKEIIAMAHYMKGFDGQFVLAYLQEQGVKPTIINKGLELMSLSVGKVKLIDSLNFMPMALSALPKAFGVEELAKGHFPHLFNRRENQTYVGSWPAAHFYSPDSMKPSARESFDKWYDQQKDKVFNFRAEIMKYCESDVDILRRCALKFRDIFISKTGMDPYAKSLTIAGACNRVFRQLFLKENVIGIIPHGGYRRSDKQSNVAIKWLKWISQTEGIEIRYSRNHGEKKVGKYKVDGISGRRVFEFNGCYWHGCPKCMTQRNKITADRYLTAHAAYQRTVERRIYIENQGYQITEMWECDLNAQLRTNKEMKEFFESVKIMDPLDPRAAFFGGRTNAVVLKSEVARDVNGEPTERIDYTDICSLYPYVCKYGIFPIGHPKIFTENFEEISKDKHPYEGLIMCKILPPQNLLHPLLPYRRCNKKLTFPLCRTCAQMKLMRCGHNDDERALVGSWVSLEIYKALDLGYKMMEIYEVWHYEKTEKFDPDTNPDGGLFAGYINTFIKMKQQADGWPGWVQTEEDKDRYIRDYKMHEGVDLVKEEIEKNPGLRALSKLMLNSFWGKFGQRNNMSKMEFFTEPSNYYQHIFEPGRIVSSITIVSDHMVAVTSTMENDFVDVMGNTNPVIAAYTTSQARLKLYTYIEKLGERLCYFDTDSIVYKSKLNDDSQYKVPIGSYLGMMTDELKDYGVGSFINRFISGGPKNYALEVYSTKDKKLHYVIKVRGFAITSGNRDQINFERLNHLVTEFVVNNNIVEVPIPLTRIERTRERDVVTKNSVKKYRLVYDKRIVNRDYTTFPYGWKY